MKSTVKSVSRRRSSVTIVVSQPSGAPGNWMISTHGLLASTLASWLHYISIKDSSSTSLSTGIVILRNIDRIEISLAIFFGCFEIEIGSPEIVEALIGEIARQPQDRKEHHGENHVPSSATSQIERISDEGLTFRTIFSCGCMAATTARASRVSWFGDWVFFLILLN